MWQVAIAIVLGIPALYGVYTTFVALRLLVEARHLRRECASRKLTLETSLSTLDLEDPLVLDVVVKRGRRRLSFTVFRSIMSYTFTRVNVEPVTLASELRGRVYLQPKDDLSSGIASHYLSQGSAELLAFGIDDLDARYRLCEMKENANSAEGHALLRATFAHPDVQTQLAAYGGSLEIAYKRLCVQPASRGTPFFDALEQVAQLADALDGAVKASGPYR